MLLSSHSACSTVGLKFQLGIALLGWWCSGYVKITWIEKVSGNNFYLLIDIGSPTYLLGGMQDVCSKVFTQNSDGWNIWAYMRWPFLLKDSAVFDENLLYTWHIYPNYTYNFGAKKFCQVSKSQKLSTAVHRKTSCWWCHGQIVICFP